MSGEKNFRRCELKEVSVVGNFAMGSYYTAKLNCPNPSANNTEVKEKPRTLVEKLRETGYTKAYETEEEVRTALARVAGKQACRDCKFAGMSSAEFNTAQAVERSALAENIKAQAALVRARAELAQAQLDAADLVDGINQAAGLSQVQVNPGNIPTPEQ